MGNLCLTRYENQGLVIINKYTGEQIRIRAAKNSNKKLLNIVVDAPLNYSVLREELVMQQLDPDFLQTVANPIDKHNNRRDDRAPHLVDWE